MKLAFTADVHLTTREDHPERFNALENIFGQCDELDIDYLIIAGDLFDEARQNFADFETSLSKYASDDLKILVLPGNHDPELTSQSFAVKNLRVCERPELSTFEGSDPPFLLLPYAPDRTMGEEIAAFQDKLTPGSWVLVGHGDWAAGLLSPNPYERGVFMPLTRSDLNTYQPAEVFLGHIHMPYDDDRVHYPGSPCPMDITETGARRFLVFDTEDQKIEECAVDSDHIYFDERFVLLPVEDEEAFLREQISRRIEGWRLPENLKERVQVRVRFSGYVENRTRVREIAEEMFSDFQFYEANPPDLTQLNLATDSDRIHIARRVGIWLADLDWPAGAEEPSRDEILTEALKVIYEA
jgi:exonuclease SbcD